MDPPLVGVCGLVGVLGVVVPGAEVSGVLGGGGVPANDRFNAKNITTATDIPITFDDSFMVTLSTDNRLEAPAMPVTFMRC